MFYSHTLLARKTPLGTVWCAAHLQHRLNKKDYEKTKIPVVVDAIMFGEVPLALRTSSYLLLGVVRIYSKQIDYLKHDVDVLVMELRKMHMHASAILTLPDSVYQAPFYSITLPATFDLDALELDSDIYHDGVPDTHMKSQEEITLADQTYIGRDAYLDISFDEDVVHDSTHPGGSSDQFISMEDVMIPPSHMDITMNIEVPSVIEDVLNTGDDGDNMPHSFPEVEVPDAMNVQDFGPSNQSIPEGDGSPQNVPEMEVPREVVPFFSPKDVPTVSPPGGDVISKPPSPIDENINPDKLPIIEEDKMTPTKTSLPHELSAGPPTSASAPEAFSQPSVEHVLQPTPPQQPRPRSRKRKQFFDKSTVLTNKFMKKALEDSSDLLRERRNIPSSSLEVWKLNNKLREKEVFHHPSITGLCHNLSDIFNVNYIATKCRTISSEEALENLGDARNVASTSETLSGLVDAPSLAPEVASTPYTEIPTTVDPAGNIPSAGETVLLPIVAPSPEAASSPHSRIPPTVTPASVSYSGMEIEHMCDVEGNRGGDTLGDLDASPERPMPSPRPSEGLDSPVPVSTEPSKSMFETPVTIHEGLGAEDLTLSDKPIGTADEDLYFLEADSSPASKSRSQGTHGVESLSVRTRAVGRYLRSLSPMKSISDNSNQDLSLNGIVEGKRRKLCARMFYETLVLKSYGLIDIQQDVPYGDITLKLTPKLSMAQI